MIIGIIGSWQSGKTSLFEALGGKPHPELHFEDGLPRPNIAALKLPDQRVEKLAESFKPKKVTLAEMQLLDSIGRETDAEKVLNEAVLYFLGNAELLLAVIRQFEGQGLSYEDPLKEIQSIEDEMKSSDMVKIEHRLDSLEKSLKKLGGKERETGEKEQHLLLQFQEHLNSGKALRELHVSEEEDKLVRGYQFFSAKPILYLLNVGEDRLQENLADKIKETINAEHVGVSQLCAKLESDLRQLEGEEREEFMRDYGLSHLSGEQLLWECLGTAGKIFFFTVNPNEVHPWAVRTGTVARKAAGEVHSDFEHGFIRAEVIPWDTLIETGGFSQAKKVGLVRTEGKDYVVQDGEVIHFLFHA